MESIVITIGNEVVKGNIVNTHLQTISRGLERSGIDVKQHFAVKDNPQDILDILNYVSHKGVELIIMTGGLGPTEDDLTKENLCQFLSIQPEFSEIEENRIKQLLKERGVPYTLNNRKQAYLIKGATLLQNRVGIVSGFCIEKKNMIYVLLPGPSNEMTPMFEEELLPFLKKHYSHKIGVIIVKEVWVLQVPESLVEDKIKFLIQEFEKKRIIISTYVNEGYVIVRVSGMDSKKEDFEFAFERVKQELSSYSLIVNETTLEEAVVKKLKENHIKLCLAESCTGGLIASRLVSVKGASAVFDFSLVTYSNRSKKNLLGVKDSTLTQFSAVSEEVVKEMIGGLQTQHNRYEDLEKTNEKISYIAVSGYLPSSPEVNETQKEMGTVFIAYNFNENSEIKIEKLKMGTEREKARFSVTQKVLLTLYQFLNEGKIN